MQPGRQAESLPQVRNGTLLTISPEARGPSPTSASDQVTDNRA